MPMQRRICRSTGAESIHIANNSPAFLNVLLTLVAFNGMKGATYMNWRLGALALWGRLVGRNQVVERETASGQEMQRMESWKHLMDATGISRKAECTITTSIPFASGRN